MPDYFLFIKHGGLGPVPQLFCRVDDLSEEEIHTLVEAIEGHLEGMPKVTPEQVDKLSLVQRLQYQEIWDQRGRWLPGHYFLPREQDWGTLYVGRAHDTALRMAANLRGMRQENFIPNAKKTLSNQPAGEADTETGITAIKNSEADWRKIQKSLIEMCERAESYRPYEELAQQLRCSKSTIEKAFNPPSDNRQLTEKEKQEVHARAKKLKKWQAQAKNGTPKATSLSEVVTDNVAQISDPDPADNLSDEEVDTAMAHLLQDAAPHERDELNSLDRDDRREMAKLFYAQRRDYEPSPLEEDRPGTKPRQVKAFKQV